MSHGKSPSSIVPLSIALLFSVFLFSVLLQTSLESGAALSLRREIESGTALFDVRTENEFRAGHLRGAVHLHYGDPTVLTADQDQKMILYSNGGGESERMRETLVGMGYRNVVNAGSLRDLLRVGVPYDTGELSSRRKEALAALSR